MEDTGKRLVKGANASFDTSTHSRTEHSQQMSKANSFTQMASWAQHNAGALNDNLNQAYVDWLKNESLPQSTGAMGIHEAETILSSRPDLNRAYQRRFLEEHVSQEGSPGSRSDSQPL